LIQEGKKTDRLAERALRREDISFTQVIFNPSG
jgi:hypothetical protein